ncbi:hypothetical protein ACFPMF_11290 [Larkinella bovis]|uniref:Outer membrane protein beta-barrel domain-containing protein n=1 Tax=Larkinella bovis TaxID=683041 RepID=A0ABW0IBH5_9BACT
MASLQELPDDELDKLFRSSAGEFEPPYNAGDWNSLRRRLDDDDRKRLLDRFIYWGLPLLLLLLTTVSLLSPSTEVRSSAQVVTKRPGVVSTPEAGAPASSDHQDKAPAVAGEAESSRTKSAAATASTEIVSANDPTRENRNLEKPADKRPSVPPAGSEQPETESKAITRPSKPGTVVTGKPADAPVTPVGTTRRIAENRLAKTSRTGFARRTDSKRDTGNGSKNLKGSDTVSDGISSPVFSRRNRRETGLGAPVNPGEGRESNASPVNTVQETAPFALRGNLSYISARTPNQPILPRIPEPDLEPVAPPVVPNAGPPPLPVIGYPALSVRFVLAPDWNFVGKSTKAATDFQLGLLGEFRFARRFTIQSGVIRSVKKYTAAASDYTKPEHWYGPSYESVAAVCTILDIPVNLRFDALVNERQRWFISSGFSSYIMQKEYYKYQYPYGVNPSQKKYEEWSGQSGFHEFSHLNFSLGYERTFSPDGPLRRFSWQVEPFLKYARRSTLGYGKIRLTSTGLFFSLRYRL